MTVKYSSQLSRITAVNVESVAAVERLGEQRGNVDDAQLAPRRADAVVEHHGAEGARHRERLGARLGGLAHALLVDRAAGLLHPHVRAAGAAAECLLAAPLHLHGAP